MRVFLLSFGGLWRVFARLSCIPVFRDTPSAYQIRQYCLAYKISRLLSGSQLKRKLKGLWRKHVGSPTVALINEMNPVISGWSNYFRIGVAKEVFAALDSFMYERAQRYMG